MNGPGPVSSPPGLSQAAADARYVQKAGDTMTGPLVIDGASAFTGKLLDLQSNNVSKASFDQTGKLVINHFGQNINIFDDDGTTLRFAVDSGTCRSYTFDTIGGNVASMGSSDGAPPGFRLSNAGQFIFSSTSDWFGTPDVGFARNAAGAIEINTGTVGTLATLIAAIIKGGTTGIDIGSANTDKVGLYGVTPVVQPATTGTVAGFTQGTGTIAMSSSTYTGNIGSSAFTVGDIVNALKKIGIMAA